jgi:hypothetical protein
MKGHKVFGIGFHKTGTKSLAAALRQLGYSVTGPNGVDNPNISRDVYGMAFGLVERHDAFQDNPWPILYKEPDERYPGSKFILTLRPTKNWIKSMVQHFGEARTPMREWIYGVGCPLGNEDVYVARYERHNREVMEHFLSRPNDLLVLRLTDGDGWATLCPFLGEAIPKVDFPQVNRGSDRTKRRLYHRVLEALGRPVNNRRKQP